MADLLNRLRAALADRYTILEEIGAGGMATVFLADDLRHERKVALKVLREELAAALGPERFLREIRIAAKLQHPHILPLYDSGEAGGFLYYVMPYAAGESLRERLDREVELPVADAVRILRDITDALTYAHQQGVVHRDIKPGNVMLSGRHAMVTDFGVAKALSAAAPSDEATATGIALGTPAYMAPEQAVADTHLDHRADLYALGALAYELLTGKPPFAGLSPQAAMAAHVAVTPEPISEQRPTVPASLASLVMRCLEKKPADRWQRAEDLLPHLDALATPSGGMTPTRATPVTGARQGRKLGVRSWAVAAGGLVLVGVMGALVLRGVLAPKEEGAGAGAVEDAPERLVVVPPEDRTGDPAAADWGFMAAEVMTRALDRAMVVAVVPASAVRDRVREVDPSAGGMPVDELARRTGARYAVAGSYTMSAGRVRFDVELTDAVSGDLLRAIDPVVGPVDPLEAVLALLADRVAAITMAALSPDVSPGLGRPSNPPDLEALRSLLAVQDLFCRQRYPEAIERARPALEAAPDFAALMLTTLIAQSNLGQKREADSLLTALEPLRDRLTLSERLLAEWMHGNIHGDRAEATRAVERLFRLQPGHWGYQAAWTAIQANRHADALERFLAYDLDTPCTRSWVPWWTFLALTYHMLGRHEEQLDIARRGLERFPDYAPLTYYETVALVALGRLAEADSVLEVLEGMPVPPGNSPACSRHSWPWSSGSTGIGRSTRRSWTGCWPGSPPAPPGSCATSGAGRSTTPNGGPTPTRSSPPSSRNPPRTWITGDTGRDAGPPGPA
jgi:tRNA A-37 threonylcarbamoyl transferase component Bud32/TolB-like protein